MFSRKVISREDNWARLMTLAQSGDSAAYETLLRELVVYIKAVVRKKLDDPARADDVTQEILLALHKARHTYDSSRPFVPWFHAILRYRLMDQLRKIYVGRKFTELDLNSAYGETFSDPLMNEKLDGLMLHALESLPERQRLALQKLKLEGLSVKEAAKECGMSESALKVNAHRGYRAMREFLGEKGRNDA